MDYFYCSPENITHDSILIDGEEFSHLVHVMRKKEGDDIRVVDGKGTAYDVHLESIKKKTASGTIRHTYPQFHEPSMQVTLAVGILKNPSKFDFLVEKVTELGVTKIIPLITKRTIPQHAKIERWQKLALAAMKQCGRSYLPNVKNLLSFDELLKENKHYDCMLIAHEQANEPFPFEQCSSNNVHSALIVVGPEGGFSDEEVSSAVTAGCRPVFLGERRLRTETAAIVMTGFSLL